MKHINKTYYWIGLLIFFGLIIGLRLFGLFTEIKIEVFYSIFGLWICLIILPLFAEIEFFGIKLKKEIENLKNDVKSEMQSIKFEIKNSNKQQVFLNYDIAPSENKINELEQRISTLYKGKLTVLRSSKKNSTEAEDKNTESTSSEIFEVSKSVLQLFQIRFKLEEALKIAWKKYPNISGHNEKTISPFQMLNDLKDLDLIDENISKITMWVLSTCNASIHGKMITKRQRDFVLENSELIYETLTDIVNEK